LACLTSERAGEVAARAGAREALCMEEQESKATQDEQAEVKGDGVVVRCSPQLNGSQRRYLRALGHHLEPVVLVGEKGVHDGIIAQIRRALIDHELIKVKLRERDASEREEAAERFFREANAQVVQILGGVVMLYKRNQERPKIELPKPKGAKKR
jgi:RNA-binding protein